MNLERIKEKLSQKFAAEADQIVNIIEKYNLKLTIRNFDEQGVFFFDEKKRKVRVVNATKGYSGIYTDIPESDIAIVYLENLLSGWIEVEKMKNIKGKMFVDPKSLHKMPVTFCFDQQCPHMDVFGGFYEGEFWECAGCGERLVFNDN